MNNITVTKHNYKSYSFPISFLQGYQNVAIVPSPMASMISNFRGISKYCIHARGAARWNVYPGSDYECVLGSKHLRKSCGIEHDRSASVLANGRVKSYQ